MVTLLPSLLLCRSLAEKQGVSLLCEQIKAMSNPVQSAGSLAPLCVPAESVLMTISPCGLTRVVEMGGVLSGKTYSYTIIGAQNELAI